MGLLLSRRFLPFFLCQFLGAFNDNLFRSALVVLISFGLFKNDHSAAWVQLAPAIFILPFFLFSIMAGDRVDRGGKRAMLIGTKIAELLIMATAAAAIHLASLPLFLFCLLLTGVQSAFFGPIKYSLLPELLHRDELLTGNAWFSASTFAAIVLGILLGAAAASGSYLPWLVGGWLLCSVLGILTAVAVPHGRFHPPTVTAPPPPAWRSFKATLSSVCADKGMFCLIIGGSLFWMISSMVLAELPNSGKAHYAPSLSMLFLGVAAGAGLCAVILRGEVSNRYAVVALLVATVLMIFCAVVFTPAADSPPYLLFIGIFAFAAAMIVYVVPVVASIQRLAGDDTRARVIASYNVLNALFIVIGGVIAALLHTVAGAAASAAVLSLAALLTLFAAVWGITLLPIETLRHGLRVLIGRLYRVEVRGLENLPQEKSVIICNHCSLLDGPLLSIFLENGDRRFLYAIDRHQAQQFLARFILNRSFYAAVDSMQPQGIRKLIHEANRHAHISPMIFPEGRLTSTGGLMKTFPGTGVIAQRVCGGRVTPVHIDGTQYSHSSNLRGKLKLRWFPRVTITVGKTRQLAVNPKESHHRQRDSMIHQINVIMEQQALAGRRQSANLTQLFLDGQARHGGDKILFCEFSPLRRLNYRRFFAAAVALGERLHRHGAVDHGRIGLLVPSSIGATAAFYGAVFHGLTPVLLNPSSGPRQVLSACRTTTVETVFTARALVERLPASQRIIDALTEQGIRVVYLEDLRAQIRLPQKLRALAAMRFPSRFGKRLPGFHRHSDSAAAVLLTSGTEGDPKGVVLSHRNLISNCAQTLVRVSVNHDEVLLNTLPVFHSFGLLAGLILPVDAGIETWQYPSPLHYRIVPEALYFSNATLFFSTNTFLSNYAKHAAPMTFHHLRRVYAGAEKLREETRQTWLQRFGVRLFQGYGVTETSPVISVNSDLFCQDGSVGRILPGIEVSLRPVEGINDGQKLCVKGDNIMLGYLLADNPGELRPPPEGWHDTGDIVRLDDEDYLTILGRAKRFIKIAGEMVPLDGVEAQLKKHWPETEFALVGVADAKRGERLALMTTTALTRDEVLRALQADGMPELWAPKDIQVIDELPMLASGKVDYRSIQATFEESQTEDSEDD